MTPISSHPSYSSSALRIPHPMRTLLTQSAHVVRKNAFSLSLAVSSAVLGALHHGRLNRSICSSVPVRPPRIKLENFGATVVLLKERALRKLVLRPSFWAASSRHYIKAFHPSCTIFPNTCQHHRSPRAVPYLLFTFINTITSIPASRISPCVLSTRLAPLTCSYLLRAHTRNLADHRKPWPGVAANQCPNLQSSCEFSSISEKKKRFKITRLLTVVRKTASSSPSSSSS